MACFLLEIGSEEIPSRFIAKEEKDLERLFTEALAEEGLKFSSIAVLATPRRLAMKIEGLPARQPTREEIITGPPARLAHDADGNPAKPLLGFAKTNAVSLDEVFRIITPKGEYMACRKETGGKPTSKILAEMAPRIIAALPFAKSMRWGDNDIVYARPLRWILALLDNEVISFQLGPIVSGRETWGHRVHGKGPFSVANPEEYEQILAQNCAITLDPQKRRELIKKGGNDLAAQKNGEVIWKDSLLEEVEGLVEHPVPMLGNFDPAYLEIPAEVLLTSMETHQKSFGIRGQDGALLPHFLTVLNLTPNDMELVRQGWERVLRARLEDARFFWRSDLEQSFEQWLAKLEKVIFIGPLGSMADKSRRLEKLCGWIAGQLNPPADVQLARRSGKLAKADLVSGMVGEFDTLQGIMGGIYAEKAGENPEIAQAIREQYLPQGPDSPLPQSLLGAILSMADKADTLAGCFGLNMIPTGMADPNGLRRCALGIIRIMLARNVEIPVSQLFEKAIDFYGSINWKLPPKEALDKLKEFFGARLRHYFLNLGYNTILVDAVLASGLENVPDCQSRLEAMTAFSKSQDYEKSVQTLKRVENISRKENVEGVKIWDDKLLQDDAEKALSDALRQILPRLDASLARKDYQEALGELLHLREPVDNFFDNTMVLCEDQELRKNRLRMLNAIARRFAVMARFSALQV